jgi:hypothetical protein
MNRVFMKMEIDQAYLVSVTDLREVCRELTHGKFHYEVTESCDEYVAVTYSESEDGLNASTFTFPIVADLRFPLVSMEDYEDDQFACLHVYTHRQPRRRMYMEDGEIKMDCITDWLRFWTPLDALLLRKSTTPGLV